MNKYEIKAQACTTPEEARALYYAAPSGSAAEEVYEARWTELANAEAEKNSLKSRRGGASRGTSRRKRN